MYHNWSLRCKYSTMNSFSQGQTVAIRPMHAFRMRKVFLMINLYFHYYHIRFIILLTTPPIHVYLPYPAMRRQSGMEIAYRGPRATYIFILTISGLLSSLLLLLFTCTCPTQLCAGSLGWKLHTVAHVGCGLSR